MNTTKAKTKVGQSKIQAATHFVQSLPEIIDGDEGRETITVNLDIELSASAWFIIATIAKRRKWRVEDVIELTVDRHVEREAEADQRRALQPANFGLS
jgi:hypothetical protein